ncbi:uncharacterized protein LOC124288184 [Haliotis rubra]|uniref:uncharacterized protein LOC124288183 n=1 Tax=Haliotis rubra TaxID=36100 RepID=UPI001EE5C4B9|nr:uncharacterized protein LOC124288183 [Haliotis rubra]XP_046580727.1 uncharacterized protein LOC124288184 [Haliotis rubra]
MWINPVAIAAFVLTLVATVLVDLAMFLPYWWRVTSARGTYINYGLWTKSQCGEDGSCVLSVTYEIEGGKEFLFISKIFMTFAVVLTQVALILHIIYVPIRKVVVRSIAIYCLGAAGLFVLLAFTIFLGKHQVLVERSKEFAVGWSICPAVLGCVISLVASGLTALASIKKAKRHEDEERLAGVV